MSRSAPGVARNSQVLLEAATRAFVSGVKKQRGRHVEGFGNSSEATYRDAVGAFLVLLHLLERDAYSVRQFRLAQSQFLPLRAHESTDFHISRCRFARSQSSPPLQRPGQWPERPGEHKLGTVAIESRRRVYCDFRDQRPTLEATRRRARWPLRCVAPPGPQDPGLCGVGPSFQIRHGSSCSGPLRLLLSVNGPWEVSPSA
jgi:hypothetical protein